VIYLRDIEAIRCYLTGGDDTEFAYRTPRTRQEVVENLDKLIAELKEFAKVQAFAQVAIGLNRPSASMTESKK
jgi:hypothetical protein